MAWQKQLWIPLSPDMGDILLSPATVLEGDFPMHQEVLNAFHAYLRLFKMSGFCRGA